MPSLDDAIELAAACSRTMSEVARAGFESAALADLRAVDERLGSGVFEDPASFAAEMAGRYLIGAGDLVCGLQYVAAPSTGLQISSAALARSACEHATRAWWLADPAATVEQRIARAIAVLRDTLPREADALEPTVVAGLRGLLHEVNKWHGVQGFREKIKLPGAKNLFVLMNGQKGAAHYLRLSNAVHGSFITLAIRYNAAISDSDEAKSETWYRILTACLYGLQAADRLTELQGRPQPLALDQCMQAWNHFMTLWFQWEAGRSDSERP